MTVDDVWDFRNGVIRDAFARRYPYVWNVGGGYVLTRYGRVDMPYGFLWDGDSAVIDTSQIGSGVHDLVYLLPQVTDKNGRVRRLSLLQCNRIYADLQLSTRHPLIRLPEAVVAGFRFVGLELANRVGIGPWRRYRAREARMGLEAWAEYVAQMRVLPRAANWKLPTTYTRDAVWMGT